MGLISAVKEARHHIQGILPPPKGLSISQWADEYLYLSPEDSSEPGKYRGGRAPYQRGMLDAVSDPITREIVFCTGSQIGKTLLLKCVIGYYMVSLQPSQVPFHGDF